MPITTGPLAPAWKAAATRSSETSGHRAQRSQHDLKFLLNFSRVDLMAGWRYERWNFDDNPVLDNMYINGPIAGVKIRF